MVHCPELGTGPCKPSSVREQEENAPRQSLALCFALIELLFWNHKKFRFKLAHWTLFLYQGQTPHFSLLIYLRVEEGFVTSEDYPQ